MTLDVIPIMCYLYDNEAVSFFSGSTIAEIHDSKHCRKYTASTLYNNLRCLVDDGFVGVGATSGRAYTYYLTVTAHMSCHQTDFFICQETAHICVIYCLGRQITCLPMNYRLTCLDSSMIA